MEQKTNNIAKVIDQGIIWNTILEYLKTKYIVEYSGTNPYYLKINKKENYVFLRNLTRAYTNHSPDVCRIQLHKSEKFKIVKSSFLSFIVIGYCEKYNTVACWSSENVKPRLNGKGNVSLYSRFSEQLPVENGKIRIFYLSNRESVKVVNIRDIDLLFLNEDSIIEKSNKTKSNFSLNELPFLSIKDGFNEDELFLLVVNSLTDSSELKSIEICISYFERHNKEYDLISIRDIISKFKKIKK